MFPILLVILILGALYWFPVRRWMNRWGATPSDLARVMRGDSLLVDATYSGTMAVTVNAPPEDIWPWLVQMGYQRGGLYSYDWLGLTPGSTYGFQVQALGATGYTAWSTMETIMCT